MCTDFRFGQTTVTGLFLYILNNKLIIEYNGHITVWTVKYVFCYLNIIAEPKCGPIPSALHSIFLIVRVSWVDDPSFTLAL